MRAVVLTLVFASALVASVSSFAGASAETSLRVTYWEDSAKPSASVSWTLRCEPPRGSLARPAVACRKLAAGGTRWFVPLRKDIVCTEIYGGPQKARIVGTVGDRQVWATFNRVNGCAIERWSRISPWLIPPGGVT